MPGSEPKSRYQFNSGSWRGPNSSKFASHDDVRRYTGELAGKVREYEAQVENVLTMLEAAQRGLDHAKAEQAKFIDENKKARAANKKVFVELAAAEQQQQQQSSSAAEQQQQHDDDYYGFTWVAGDEHEPEAEQQDQAHRAASSSTD